jgi:hypothetical protein
LVAKDVRGMRLDTRQLAWLVLETLNRTQAKGTTVRLVVPRDPEVAHQLDPTLAEHKLWWPSGPLPARAPPSTTPALERRGRRCCGRCHLRELA